MTIITASSRARLIGRIIGAFGTIMLIALTVSIYFTLNQAEEAFTAATTESLVSEEIYTIPFPVGVTPQRALITENPSVNTFMTEVLAIIPEERAKVSLFEKIERVIVQAGWYQQLASPVSRILVIWPGERKEEIVDNIGDILNWSTDERAAFIEMVVASPRGQREGTFFPGRYVVPIDATPTFVATQINARFEEVVGSRYTEDIEEIVPLSDTLALASLLEREAYSFEHMRLISGVIWNRLFIDMPLQIDATLQYAKSNITSDTWWPVPIPADKFIVSEFNTYQNNGLPPAAIANPSAAAIVAALNPYATDCYFYFHDTDGEIYCSETYAAHVEKLRTLFGQGR